MRSIGQLNLDADALVEAFQAQPLEDADNAVGQVHHAYGQCLTDPPLPIGTSQHVIRYVPTVIPRTCSECHTSVPINVSWVRFQGPACSRRACAVVCSRARRGACRTRRYGRSSTPLPHPYQSAAPVDVVPRDRIRRWTYVAHLQPAKARGSDSPTPCHLRSSLTRPANGSTARHTALLKRVVHRTSAHSRGHAAHHRTKVRHVLRLSFATRIRSQPLGHKPAA